MAPILNPPVTNLPVTLPPPLDMEAYYKEVQTIQPYMGLVYNPESPAPDKMEMGWIDKPGYYWENYAPIAAKYPREHEESVRRSDEVNKDSWKPIIWTLGAPLLVFGLGAAFLPAAAAEGAVVAGEGALFVSGGEAVATGAETFAAYDAALAAGAAEGVGSTAGVFTGEAVAVESFAAYDAALAAGAAEGVGSAAGATVATGAGTSILSGGGGLLSSFGIGKILNDVFGQATEIGATGLNTFLDREIQSMFGGNGSPGAAGGGIGGSESGSILSSSYFPLILIALTMAGAFILTRKGRK